MRYSKRKSNTLGEIIISFIFYCLFVALLAVHTGEFVTCAHKIRQMRFARAVEAKWPIDIARTLGHSASSHELYSIGIRILHVHCVHACRSPCSRLGCAGSRAHIEQIEIRLRSY